MRKRLPLLLVLLVLLTATSMLPVWAIVLTPDEPTVKVQATGGWLDGWNHRIQLSIAGSETGSVTDYQMRARVFYDDSTRLIQKARPLFYSIALNNSGDASYYDQDDIFVGDAVKANGKYYVIIGASREKTGNGCHKWRPMLYESPNGKDTWTRSGDSATPPGALFEPGGTGYISFNPHAYFFEDGVHYIIGAQQKDGIDYCSGTDLIDMWIANSTSLETGWNTPVYFMKGADFGLNDTIGAPSFQKVGSVYYMSVSWDSIYGVAMLKCTSSDWKDYNNWSVIGGVSAGVPNLILDPAHGSTPTWATNYIYDSTLFPFGDQWAILSFASSSGDIKNAFFAYASNIEATKWTFGTRFMRMPGGSHPVFGGRGAVLWEHDGVHGYDEGILKLWTDWRHSEGGAFTNIGYFEEALISLEGYCQTDFDDIRFTGSDGETTMYVAEWESTPSDQAVFYYEVPSIPTGETTTVYLYYGNDAVGSASDFANTFVHYNDGTTTTGYTTVYGALTGNVGGRLRHVGTSANWNRGSWYADIGTGDTDGGFIWEGEVYVTTAGQDQGGITYWADSNSNFFLVHPDADQDLLRINNIDAGAWGANRNQSISINTSTDYYLQVRAYGGSENIHVVYFNVAGLNYIELRDVYIRGNTGYESGQLHILGTSRPDGGSDARFDWQMIRKYIYLEPNYVEIEAKEVRRNVAVSPSGLLFSIK